MTESEKDLKKLNNYANIIIGRIYPEIDNIVITLIDNRYLEYNVYLNVDMLDSKEVMDEIDPLYLVDVNILKDVKSFLPDLKLPIKGDYNVIVYNDDGDEVFNWIVQLGKMYDRNPSSTGGSQYRRMKTN